MSAYDPKRTLTTLGGFEGGVLAVLADQLVGGAEDVEVADHECRTSSTAVSASEAEMPVRAWRTSDIVSCERQSNHPDHGSYLRQFCPLLRTWIALRAPPNSHDNEKVVGDGQGESERDQRRVCIVYEQGKKHEMGDEIQRQPIENGVVPESSPQWEFARPQLFDKLYPPAP